MKHVLTIIGIGLVVASVLLKVDHKQKNDEALQELERIGIEMHIIADRLETTGDIKTTISMLRYQSQNVKEYVGN